MQKYVANMQKYQEICEQYAINMQLYAQNLSK